MSMNIIRKGFYENWIQRVLIAQSNNAGMMLAGVIDTGLNFSIDCFMHGADPAGRP